MRSLLFVAISVLLFHAAIAEDAKKPMEAQRVADRKSQLVAQTRDRIRQIDSILQTVKWEAPAETRRELPAGERKLDTEFNQWLKSVRARLQTVKKDMQQFGSSNVDAKMVEEMAQMNAQFLALQKSLQAESRRFTTLSSASKARHDVAMNAMQNME